MDVALLRTWGKAGCQRATQGLPVQQIPVLSAALPVQVSVLEDSNVCAIHAGRVTIM